ncbi:MAG: hypothetical protein WEC75_14380 [Dehalococcoidia bacterium]
MKRGWRRVPLAVRIGVFAVAGVAVLVAVRQTSADPSFGLLGSGDVLRPPSYQPVVPSDIPNQPAYVVALPASALGLSGATLDGLSYGNDDPSVQDVIVVFSVDNTSAGYPRATHDVYAETLGVDAAAAADVFSITEPLPNAYGPGCGPAMRNRLIIDGDGLLGKGAPRAEAPGIGLDEDPPGPPGTANRSELSFLEMSGAVVVDTESAGPDGDVDGAVFFSVPDDTAQFGPGTGADIYLKPGSGSLVKFADADGDLGLDAEDEIDALAVYDAGTSGELDEDDIVVFSLAPGSPSLDTLETNCFEAGDATGADLWVWTETGELAPYLDGEQLGLCVKRSYGLCNPFSEDGDDNVDALDLVTASGTDTDGDGIDDAVDPDDDGDGEGESLAACEDDEDDNDCVFGSADNCPDDYNPTQLNSDSGRPTAAYPGNRGAHDNGPGVPLDDGSIPNGDGVGDVCDADHDNDGLPDADELSSTACGSFDLSGTTHPAPEGGDVTNDDDGDAYPAPLMGADTDDDGPSWDTDNDGKLDGWECANGYNPRDVSSRPASVNPDVDTDGDGLKDSWEVSGWGTDPSVIDSDGDGLGDCKEAADVDGNGAVNFSGDVIHAANAALVAGFGKTQVFDIDKNGVVNFSGDVLTLARFALTANLCK